MSKLTDDERYRASWGYQLREAKKRQADAVVALLRLVIGWFR